MLTSLDAIDWAALGSATVSAADVPALLPAVDELVNAVYHQETVWECTEPAVPFLAGLTLTPSVSHRASLLYLLASLSRSVVAGAVSEHLPRLSDLLADPDPEIREVAGYLVGAHDEHAERTVPMLTDRWAREREPLARASVWRRWVRPGCRCRSRGQGCGPAAAGGLVLRGVRRGALGQPESQPYRGRGLG